MRILVYVGLSAERLEFRPGGMDCRLENSEPLSQDVLDAVGVLVVAEFDREVIRALDEEHGVAIRQFAVEEAAHRSCRLL